MRGHYNTVLSIQTRDAHTRTLVLAPYSRTLRTEHEKYGVQPYSWGTNFSTGYGHFHQHGVRGVRRVRKFVWASLIQALNQTNTKNTQEVLGHSTKHKNPNRPWHGELTLNPFSNQLRKFTRKNSEKSTLAGVLFAHLWSRPTVVDLID